ERRAIQAATDSLGRSDVVPGVLPRPVESGSQPSQPQQSLVRPIAVDDPTLGAKPSTLAAGQAHTSRAWIPLVAVTVLLFIAGAAIAFVVVKPDGGEPEARPTAPAAPAPVEPSPAEPVLQVPPPAADVEPALAQPEEVQPERVQPDPPAAQATAGDVDERTRPRRRSRARRAEPETRREQP